MAMHFGLGLGLQLHAIYLLVFLAFHASSCEQEDYWQMKLPKVPMPQAIKDNLFHPKDQKSMTTSSIETNKKVTQGNDANKVKKASVNQPYTVMGRKYGADNEKEKVGLDQPYTVTAWKYNTDDEKKRIGVDQPYTVTTWKYNTDDERKRRIGVDQPYTVTAWKYNTDDERKRVGVDQPYTVTAWKYNTDDKRKRVGVDQPYTVTAWKYNTNDERKRMGVDQPYTVTAGKYNTDDERKSTGVDQPYTVTAWKYNTDDERKRIGVDQPYTVTAWKYNTDDERKRIGVDQPYTVTAWKYNADNAKEQVGLHQPYTDMGWKYNKNNGDKEKDNDVSSGSVFFIEKSLRLGEKLKHDFQKTSSVPFLPKHIVQSIPFSEDKITQILDLFSIKLGSVEESGIKGTLDICLHRPKVEKENRTCAQSMEDVVDFVVRELGSNDVELRMMRNDIEVPKGIQDYVITKVKKLDVPGNTAAACHRMSYPYVVYYCHHQKDIGHYDVTLVNPTTKTAIQTTAVCHYDTYAWKPNVPALQYLGIRPGDAPVCHFSAINDMFWSLKANSKSLDMVV